MHHHVRRRSGHGHGHGHGHTSSTDVRRNPLDTHISSKHCKTSSKDIRKPMKSPRSSSHAQETRGAETDYFGADAESFPQYCMVCDKQFYHQSETPYCSPTCLASDSVPSSTTRPISYTDVRPSSYANHSGEPFRDIIPRASPSRPTSNYFSTSPPLSPGDGYDEALSMMGRLSLRPGSPRGEYGMARTYDVGAGRREIGYGYYEGASSMGGARAMRGYEEGVDLLR